MALQTIRDYVAHAQQTSSYLLYVNAVGRNLMYLKE